MYNGIEFDNINLTMGPPEEEPARQYYFIAKCRRHVQELERKLGRKPTFFIQTFGCPVR